MSEVEEGADNYMTESAKEPIPDSAHGLCPHCQRIEPDLTGTEMIPIGPDSKWVLVLPDNATYEDAERIADRIRKWWDGEEGFDFPIMIIGGETGFRLVRVDEHEIGPELVDCGAEYCPGHLVGGGEKCLTSHDLYQAE